MAVQGAENSQLLDQVEDLEDAEAEATPAQGSSCGPNRRFSTGAILVAGIAGALLCAAGAYRGRFGPAIRGAVASFGAAISEEENDASVTGATSTSAASTTVPATTLPEGECHDALPGEKCYDSLSWVMTEGIYGHPDWYPGLDYSARIEEFQALLHKQDPKNCPAPCKNPALARRLPGVPGASFDLENPQMTRKPVTFYMYRVQSAADYPLANVNTANLAGVFWYLHNEIVPSLAIHRKYEISRMLRYKVTIEPTWEYYNVHRRLFSGFTAFDKGRCTAAGCEKVYQRYGAIPGCQFLDVQRLPYLSSVKTRIDGGCEGKWCNASVWYALPGSCPGEPYQDKKGQCLINEPGGLCSEDGVMGTRSCTYRVENAGEISLDELSGIGNYLEFFQKGNREYDPDKDMGIGCDFWNKRQDPEKAAQRMARAKELFDTHFPDMPKCDDLPEPPCDFNAYFPDEMTWPTYASRAEDVVGSAPAPAAPPAVEAPSTDAPDAATEASATESPVSEATTTKMPTTEATTTTAWTTKPWTSGHYIHHLQHPSSASEAEAGCHDVQEGERCLSSINWVLAHGINEHPEWYPTLTTSSSISEVQAVLFSHDVTICPKPCSVEAATTTLLSS